MFNPRAEPLSDGYRRAVSPDQPTSPPTAEQLERDDLAGQILTDPARVAIYYWLTRASTLGFDTCDPDVIRRAIEAGRAEHARNVESAERVANYTALLASRRAEKKHSPVVYYMRMSDLVKIGVSTRIGQRMTSIGAQGVMAVEAGTYGLELQRHEQFAHLHDHGEWFRMAPELGAHIATVRESFTAKMGVSTEEWLREWLPRTMVKSFARRDGD